MRGISVSGLKFEQNRVLISVSGQAVSTLSWAL